MARNVWLQNLFPWLLSQEQKEFRAEVAEDMLETTNNDLDFLKKVITRDESWVYGYDPETKAQSSQWKSPESPRLKKVQRSQSNVKAMLTVFYIMKVLSTMIMLLQARH